MSERKETLLPGRPSSAISRTAAVLLALLFVLCAAGAFPGANPLCEAVSASAQEPVGARFGACEPHLKLHAEADMERELSEMEDAGIGWVRIDFAWPDLEPARGSWTFAKADAAVQKASAHGIEVLGILGATPGWANGGKFMTFPPTDIQAWREYVTTVCARYRGRVSAWEIWNEENILQFWLPWPDANAYVALAAQAAQAIRAADPSATVVMGGVAGLDPNYLVACLDAGILDHVDAVAYHPYSSTMGSSMPVEANCRYILAWLRAEIAKRTTKQVQVWLTELGWSTCAPSPPGVDRETQAYYMLRTFINYADLPVDRVFWYNLWDEAANDQDMEMNFGLLSHDFTRKPSWNAYRCFQQVFGRAEPAAPGAATVTCARPASLETHCFRLPDGGLVMGVWKSDDIDDILSVTLTGASYSEPELIDPLTGQRQDAPGASRGADGRVAVTGLSAGKRPVFLEFAPLSTPRVTGVTPANNPAGGEVTISGAGFGASRGASVVHFGSTSVSEYSTWAEDKVKCRVPAVPEGPVQLTVTTPGGSSNAFEFTVAPEGPTVTSISPSAAVEGGVVDAADLQGTGFTTGAAVSLTRSGSTIPASSVNVVSSTRITCSFSFNAGQAGKYDVVVRRADGQEARLSGGFTVSAAQCGAGGAPAVLTLGLAMGFLAAAGLGTAGRALRGPAE